MKLGVSLTINDIGPDPAAIRDYVQSLEGIGIDFVSTPEHVVGAHPDQLGGQAVHTYDKPYYEPIALFGFIAGATSRLEMATSILILPQRQTALVAKQVAMLDNLCGGRLRIGVGVGRNFVEYQVLGQDFATRGARMEEQIDVLRKLWTEELVTFHGQWHHLDQVGINPLPVQRPVPIWMGSFVGGTTDRVLKRIGRLADGWFPQMEPGDELASLLERIRTYAYQAGRDATALGVEGVTTISPMDDPAEWVKTANAFAAHGATHLKVVTKTNSNNSPDPASQLALVHQWRIAVGQIYGS
jgi:probable F420-dependent oxidoreductase